MCLFQSFCENEGTVIFFYRTFAFVAVQLIYKHFRTALKAAPPEERVLQKCLWNKQLWSGVHKATQWARTQLLLQWGSTFIQLVTYSVLS